MQLKFKFGSDKTYFEIQDQTLLLNFCSEALGDRTEINIIDHITSAEDCENHAVFKNDELVGGIFIAPVDPGFADTSYRIYSEILKLAGNNHLCRAWNYLPEINGYVQDKSVYGMFNEGRHRAFHDFFKEQAFYPPAATGIDILGEKAVIAFLATKNPVHYYANPLQVDSFHYPEKYGKLPPCFSRANKTVINGKDVVFVSGAASIRGSESVHIGNEEKQIDTTIDNIEIMLRETGVYDKIAISKEFDFDKIVYINNREHFEAIKKYIQEKYPIFDDGIYLHSNVCRKELEIEICATAYEK